MKVCAASLLMLVATTAAAQDAAPEPNAVAVMSFNVRYDNPADGPNAWPHRRDWVAEIIGKNADVVGMQEVLERQLDDLKARLPEFEFFGVGRDDGKEAGEFVPVAWRKERFAPVEKGAFWLSPTPDVPGSKGWDAALPRVATWARLKDRVEGKMFLLVNVHFDHKGEQARRESAKLLKSWIAGHAKGGPVILTGDFNATPDSAAYKTLAAEGEGLALQDTRFDASRPEGPASTWNGFKAVAENVRIDFVFQAGPVEVLGFRTLDETRDGRFPSDHLPIVATVEFGGT